MGRLLVKEGGCVSVSNDYFGGDYLNALQIVGFSADRLFGLEEYQVFRESGKLLIYGQVGCRGG